MRFVPLVLTVAALFAGVAAASPEAIASQAGRAASRTPEEILSSMTPEEKAGQTIIGFFNGDAMSGALRAALTELHLGGVILYSSSGNVSSAGQVATLVTDIQNVAAGGVPPFVAIDQEGGIVARITKGVTVWPGNMALGAAGDSRLAADQARIMARELRILGITWDYAPVADVNSNPDNPVIGVRSFGSDAGEVARFVAAMLPPFAREGVLACAKHFPGHGDVDVDSHLGLPRIDHDRARLESVELVPFRRAAALGVPSVMTAHMIVPALGATDVPATMSAQTLSFLRNDIGFGGLIVTDSLGMGAVDKQWGSVEAGVMALIAGADVLIYGADKGHTPEDQWKAHAAILEALRSGRLPQSRLDDAVLRILRAKETCGILDDPMPKLDRFDELASDANLAVACAIAEASVTLVRNDRELVPLAPLAAGSAAIPLVWQAERKDYAAPLLDAVPGLTLVELPKTPTSDDIDRVADAVGDAPVVVAGTYSLSAGSAWAEALRRIGPERLVLVALRTPYDLRALPAAATFLATYGDTEPSMTALGKVLRGVVAPKGRLPVDIPGLYPLGWGIRSLPSKGVGCSLGPGAALLALPVAAATLVRPFLSR